MAPSAKLAIISKMGEEASLQGTSACLYLLYTLVEQQPYLHIISCLLAPINIP